MVLRVFIRFRAKLGDKNKKNKGQRFIANGCPPNFTLLITEKNLICLKKDSNQLYHVAHTRKLHLERELLSHILLVE